MKKARLLITLLVMMFAASGFAQDSFREAVKEYLEACGQYDQLKSTMSDLSVMFAKDGEVDIDQLTQRYLDECYEDDLIGLLLPSLTEKGLTEADLKEVASLLSTPQGKTFTAHQNDWTQGFISDWMANLYEQLAGLDYEEDEEFHLQPIEPNADIDADYAAKFNDVILTSDVGQKIKEAVLKQFNEPEDLPSDIELEETDKETDKEMMDWIITNMPIQLLNSAYGRLTAEDLDYAAMLNSKESYRKLSDFMNSDNIQAANVTVKYLEWMKEQGATVSDDPNVVMGLLKTLLNLEDDLYPEDIDLEDINLDE